MLRLSSTILLLTLASCRSPAPEAPQNLILVTIDGLRWQEFFGGAEAGLIDPEDGGVSDPEVMRRENLLPFLWGTVARHGQIFGASETAPALVTNGLNFSFPGYAEMLCGVADSRVDSNDKRANPNPTVFGYLNRLPGFAGRVGVVASWDVFAWIHNSQSNGVFAQAGWNPMAGGDADPRVRAFNQRQAGLPRLWPSACFDALTIDAALLYLEREQPRVLHIAFDETDEWAHERRYDLYLDAARRTDEFIQRLWQKLQSMPAYRDRTTLLVTTDHGRGDGREWIRHGKAVRGSERIWIAAMGPGILPLGLRNEATSAAQIAASIAELLGEDFSTVQPMAAPALPLHR